MTAVYRSGAVSEFADSINHAGKRRQLPLHRSLEKRRKNFVLPKKFLSFQGNDGELCNLLEL